MSIRLPRPGPARLADQAGNDPFDTFALFAMMRRERDSEAMLPCAQRQHFCLSFFALLAWSLSRAAFHAAYASAYTGFLMVVYLFALLQLSRAATWRERTTPACWSTSPRGGPLEFFWRIFSAGRCVVVRLCILDPIFVAVTAFASPGKCAGRSAGGTAVAWPGC